MNETATLTPPPSAPDGEGTSPAIEPAEVGSQTTRELFEKYAGPEASPVETAAGVADGSPVDPLPDHRAGGLSARDLGIVTKGVRACLKVLDRWNCKVIFRKALAYFGPQEKAKAEQLAGDVAAMPEELDAMSELVTLWIERSLAANRNSPWIAAAAVATGYALRTATAHMQLSPAKPSPAAVPSEDTGGAA